MDATGKHDFVGDDVDELTYFTERFSRDVSARAKHIGLGTGFRSLDESLGHLGRGLYVVGAASGMGKTTFVHQICAQVAAAGGTAYFISYEMTAAELVSKSLSRMTKTIGTEPLTAAQIRDGTSNDGLDEAVKAYAATVGNRVRLKVVEPGVPFTVDDIWRYVETATARDDGKKIVAVDYLQLINRGDGDERKTTKDFVDGCVNALKALSTKADVPIFLVSTINRQNYMNLIDFESFKESSMIEASADVVLGLQPSILRSETFRSNGDVNAKRKVLAEAKERIPREVELTCLKNRAGVASFTQEFEYDPRYDLFVEKPKGRGSWQTGRRRTIVV